MLVLTRKESEVVLLGDEVTVTVEEICGSSGQRIIGARVRLGFQVPRYVSINRSECCAERPADKGQGSPERRARPRSPRLPGRVVEIPDAQVRLRIQAPRRVPILVNGTATQSLERESTGEGATQPSTTEHHITCQKEDRITICNNMAVATLQFERFVVQEAP
jgi:carbon storage regulator CsrA